MENAIGTGSGLYPYFGKHLLMFSRKKHHVGNYEQMGRLDGGKRLRDEVVSAHVLSGEHLNGCHKLLQILQATNIT